MANEDSGDEIPYIEGGKQYKGQDAEDLIFIHNLTPQQRRALFAPVLDMLQDDGTPRPTDADPPAPEPLDELTAKRYEKIGEVPFERAVQQWHYDQAHPPTTKPI